VFFAAACNGAAGVDSAAPRIRLEWQTAGAEYIGRGGYARVKKLSSGELALVFSKGGDIIFKTKKKADSGAWGAEIRAAFPSVENSYKYTNAELAELPGGELLLVWNARPIAGDNGDNGGGGNSLPYKIMAAFSRDGGATWGTPRDLYIAGNTMREGCWEPCPLQLPGPDGELQVWFANEHKLPRGSQNISVLRSRDGGKTWLPPVVASYRAGRRDGMPVPVILKDGTVVAAIEDSGLSVPGRLKPVIVRPDAAFGKAIDGKSPERWGALSPRAELPSETYAGAPYIIRLDTGETILSVQTTEGRRIEDRPAEASKFANLRVYVGDATARNFDNPTTPFPDLPKNAAALWNSLCQTDAGTLLAAATLSGQSKDNGVWLVTAKIIREPAARKQTR